MDNIKVLDHGFVRLIDWMGDDNAIVDAARISYQKGTKSYRTDRALIRYLFRHKHLTPFEMCEMKFHVKMPIFVARQWIRHRTASVNEVSARYSELPQEFYSPTSDNFCNQSDNNKQGRNNDTNTSYQFFMDEKNILRARLFHHYEKQLENNVAREIARIDLPLSIYTEWYWKIDLRNLFNFLTLRCDSHAQYEIRVYADIIANMVKEKFPIAYEAWYDYDHKSASFSRQEMDLIIQCIDKDKLKTLDLTTLSTRESENFLKGLCG